MDHILLDPKEYDPELCDLLDQMTCEEQTQRLGYNTGCRDIKKHAYFKDINWNDVANKKLEPLWYKPTDKRLK